MTATTSKLGADMTDFQINLLASHYWEIKEVMGVRTDKFDAVGFARALLARQPAAIDKEDERGAFEAEWKRSGWGDADTKNQCFHFWQARAASTSANVAQGSLPVVTAVYRAASDCPYVGASEDIKCAWADGWNQCAQFTKGSHEGY